jgi:ribonuclease D
VPPDAVRRLTWDPPDPLTRDSVVAALADYGARPWQIQLTAGPIADALCGIPAGAAEPDTLGVTAEPEG